MPQDILPYREHEHFSNRNGKLHPALCQTAAMPSWSWVMGLTGEKGYHSVDSGARYHFIIGLVIDLHDKTVQTNITIGHYYQALAPPHQYVLDALGFQQGQGGGHLSLTASSTCD